MRRRSFKRKLRRLMRRSRRTRRSRFGSRSRSQTKTGHKMKKARGVYGRMKLKGWKRKLNRKKELKFFTSQPTQVDIGSWPAAVGTVVWSNYGTRGVLFYPPPQQGTGEGQVVGTKYNLKYCELSFLLNMTQRPTNGFGQSYEMFRLMVVRQRDRSTGDPTYTNFYVGTNLVINTAINSKNWDVQYDKYFTMDTGVLSTTLITNAYGPGSTHMTPAKFFRFIIPMRESMEVVANTVTECFPLRMYVLLYTVYGSNVGAPVYTANNINATYYFNDP